MEFSRLCACVHARAHSPLGALACPECSAPPCPLPPCPKHPSLSSLAVVVKLIRSNYGGRRDPARDPTKTTSSALAQPWWPWPPGPRPGSALPGEAEPTNTTPAHRSPLSLPAATPQSHREAQTSAFVSISLKLFRPHLSSPRSVGFASQGPCRHLELDWFLPSCSSSWDSGLCGPCRGKGRGSLWGHRPLQGGPPLLLSC